MPCPLNFVSACFHDLRQVVHFLAAEALIVRKTGRACPEFRRVAILADMNVNRFPRVAFVRKEEKTITLKLEDSRRGCMLTHRPGFWLS